MTEHQRDSEWNVAEWHGKMLVDRNGEKIGKLQDVYVDVETDEPQFGTVKEGFIGRHLTFVPLGGSGSVPMTCRYRSPKSRFRMRPTSSSTARNSPSQTSRFSTTITSSTTPRLVRRADADSRAADLLSPTARLRLAHLRAGRGDARQGRGLQRSW